MNNKCEQPSHPQPNQKPQFPHKPTNHVFDQLNSSSSSNPKYHTFTTTSNHDDDQKKKNNNNMKNNNNNSNNNNNNNKVIWDCGSSLYDSVELDSFRKQLDIAIVNSSRTQSMPRRLPSDNHRAPPPHKQKKTSSSKFSRSFHKLVRSLFGAPSKADKNTQSSPDPWFFDSTATGSGSYEKDNTYYVVYEKPDIIGLSSIPEVPEGIDASPQIGRKTMSARFTTSAPISSPGIYCA